jgi:hypothetical protein
MNTKLILPAVTAVLLSAAPLLAGGLPRLCLPVDGVTADNADTCAKRLADALRLEKGVEGVVLRENGKRWYAIIHYNRDQLILAELDTALKGSPFSIPRDNLRLFGHVMLEVEVGEAAERNLLSDLKAVKHVTVEEVKRDRGVLYVTAVMPYSRYFGVEMDEFGKQPFEKELFGTAQSDFGPKANPPATARDLPTYGGLRAVVERHDGNLKGVRWKAWGCRVLGGVTAPDPAGKRE